MWIERGILDARTLALGPDHRETLACASNLAVSLARLGEHAEAAVLLRTTLAIEARTVGTDDGGTLSIK